MLPPTHPAKNSGFTFKSSPQRVDISTRHYAASPRVRTAGPHRPLSGGGPPASAKHTVLDGGTGLPDAAHVVGLKATMALVVHTRYALAIRNATFHQAYELRARVAEHASRLQSPSSSSAISITAAFAGVLDADSLKLLSHEDAKATVPASVIDAGTSDEAKKETTKSDTTQQSYTQCNTQCYTLLLV